VARTGRSTVVPWPAVSAAVGLLTAAHAGSDDDQADILGDMAPAEVLEALKVIAVAFLDSLAPGDIGAGLLERLGLLAAAETAQQLAGGPS
jgi:hypothetical protein